MKPSALFLFLTIGLVIQPQASQGQRIASLTHFASAESLARHYPATYWVEGAVVGTSLLATTGALFFYEWNCHYSDTRSSCTAGPILEGSLGAALFGGTVGALVGGLFPAPHPRPLRGHAVKAALLGTLAGAMWGFGLFTHFCLNGCNPGEVRFGLSTAAVGALAGLVVGL